MQTAQYSNLIISISGDIANAANNICKNLFPEDTDFSHNNLPLNRYYVSGADCFYTVKGATLLSFVKEAYAVVEHTSNDETHWKTFCATLSDESYKTCFAGSKCTDILFITDTRATWDSTNREWDFSGTQILGRVVFGYLHIKGKYKMSYWLTVNRGATWYDLQDSTATPIPMPRS